MFLLDRRGDPREVDLPRNVQGRALIGDPRNDENTMVSQLHCAFLQFHNAMLERLAAQGVDEDELFNRTQQQVRWHYQWVVIHDYLRRLVGDELHSQLLTQAQDDQGRPRAPGSAAALPLQGQPVHAGGVLRRRLPIRA